MSSARFVAGLRARRDVIDLVPPNERTPSWTLRVQLLEAWDAVQLRVLPTARVDQVVQAALAALAGPGASPADYDCKLRGVRLADRALSLERAGVLDGSTLLLVHAARQPVR